MFRVEIVLTLIPAYNKQTGNTAYAVLALPALREIYRTSCKRSLQRNLEMLPELGREQRTGRN